MKEVQNKWSTLKFNDDIWAKLIYFERNRRLAKAYVSAPVLTIDGSTSGLDGFRIGLSGIENTYRSLQSVGCLRSIGQGIKLKIDSQGNILIKKIGDKSALGQSQCSIWVKDWPSLSGTNNCSHLGSSKIADNVSMREIDDHDIFYKLFDMRKFRLMLEKSKLRKDDFLDWRHCVSIISFAQNVDSGPSKLTRTDILDNPCWIMLINIIAIDMLKSSISSENLSTRCNSSSLIKNHRLLESSKESKTSSRLLAVREPLHLSSSTSNLYPAPVSSRSSLLNRTRGESAITNQDEYLQHSTSTAKSSHSNSSDRVKKLRTTAGRYRSSMNKSSSNYRRYQSSQQLSVLERPTSNTIYTTFNSKYLNSKRYLKPDDATGLNSSSKGSLTSKSQWQILPQLARQPLRTSKDRRANFQVNREDDPSATLETCYPELSANYRSLSVVDLSSQRQARFARTIDLRNLQSSIKINYDDCPSEEDEDEVLAREPIEKSGKENLYDEQDALQKSSRNSLTARSKLFQDLPAPVGLAQQSQEALSSNCRCELRAARKPGSNLAAIGINHNKCEAVHGHQALVRSESDTVEQGDVGKKSQFGKLDLDAQQVVSRSSIASSSSSSGCPDNDYFMSQSSSSMSSSTASNEPEQFSQPASSSGIACSNGSTSDEYDDKPAKARGSKKSKEVDGKQACKFKSIHGDHICCLSGSTSSRLASAENLDCNCAIEDTFECDCCNCDCVYVKDTHANISRDTQECNCVDESIYDVLPAMDKSGLAFEQTTGQINKYCAPAPRAVPKQRGSSKEPKQAASWLERKKYTKMLPKFILSATNSDGPSSKTAAATLVPPQV